MARAGAPAVGRHRQYFEVRDALRQPGCPVCRLALGAVWRYLDALAYENVNDYTVREQLRRSWGFCNRHAWQYLEDVRDLLGTAIIYRDLIRSNGPTAGRPGGLTPRAECPVCAVRDRTARHALETLVRYRDDAEIADGLAASDGLCAHHAARALSLGARPLVSELVEKWTGGRNPVALAAGERGFAGTRVGWDWDPVPSAGLGALPSGGDGCRVCAALDVSYACREERDDALPCNAHLWALAGRDEGAAARVARGGLARAARRLAAPGLPPRSSLVAVVLDAVGVEPREENPLAGLVCPACLEQRAVESSLVRTAVAEGQPLCLPHARVALARSIGRRSMRTCLPHARVALDGPEDGDRILAPTRDVWRQLEAGLTAYVRSQDYRFRHEPRGDEQRAPRAAVRWIAGEPGVR